MAKAFRVFPVFRVTSPVTVVRRGKLTVVKKVELPLNVKTPFSVVKAGRLRVVVKLPPENTNPPAVVRAGRKLTELNRLRFPKVTRPVTVVRLFRLTETRVLQVLNVNTPFNVVSAGKLRERVDSLPGAPALKTNPPAVSRLGKE